jgi:hypothetical protein
MERCRKQSHVVSLTSYLSLMWCSVAMHKVDDHLQYHQACMYWSIDAAYSWCKQI